MKNTLVTLLIASVLTGCTQITPIAAQKELKPFQDPNAYAQGNWAFLAKSISKLWYYDPTSLTKDAEGIVSFESYSISVSKLASNDKNFQEQCILNERLKEQLKLNEDKRLEEQNILNENVNVSY